MFIADSLDDIVVDRNGMCRCPMSPPRKHALLEINRRRIMDSVTAIAPPITDDRHRPPAQGLAPVAH
jgi:hypothetical protein